MAFAYKKILLAGLASFTALSFAQVSQAQQIAEEPALRSTLPGTATTSAITPERVKRDYWIAFRLAKNPWFDKIAEADPRIVAAVCQHNGAARRLAMHHHLDKIAEADHYLCRRLCQWEGATQKLIRNPYADKVIALDPQGMAFALNRKPEYARLLAKHPTMNLLADYNRDFPREMQRHIR